MTAPVLDERAHFAAWQARIATGLTLVDSLGNPVIYDHGEVPGEDNNPGSLPRRFALLQVERRYLESLHSTRHATRSSWRIAVRHVGHTVDEARWVGMHVSAALDSKTIDIEGFTSTPAQHEQTNAVTADDGLFSGLAVWTYTL